MNESKESLGDRSIDLWNDLLSDHFTHQQFICSYLV